MTDRWRRKCLAIAIRRRLFAKSMDFAFGKSRPTTVHLEPACEIAARLAEAGFVRIHRWAVVCLAVVCLAAIERIEPRGNRAWRLFLSSSARIDASPRFVAALRKF